MSGAVLGHLPWLPAHLRPQARPPQPSPPSPVFSTPCDGTSFYLPLITSDMPWANFSKQNPGLFQVLCSREVAVGVRLCLEVWGQVPLDGVLGASGLLQGAPSSADPCSQCAFSLLEVFLGGVHYFPLCRPPRGGSRSMPRVISHGEDARLKVASCSLCQNRKVLKTDLCVEEKCKLVQSGHQESC